MYTQAEIVNIQLQNVGNNGNILRCPSCDTRLIDIFSSQLKPVKDDNEVIIKIKCGRCSKGVSLKL